jgi:hypothetical protein
MSNQNAEVVSVRIIPNTEGKPPGKLADAEVIFEAEAGPLSGMKLIGFSIWERRSGGGRNVTFPARQYSVNGERRSFALLRPMNDRSRGASLGRAVDGCRVHRARCRARKATRATRARGRQPVRLARGEIQGGTPPLHTSRPSACWTQRTSGLVVEPTSIAATRSRHRRGIGSGQLKVARFSGTGPNFGGTL